MVGWIIAAVIIIVIVIKVLHELRHLKISVYDICSEKLNDDFACRFVFLSDLHLRRYGQENEELIRLVKEQKPELILLGGDMTIDSPKKNEALLYPVLEKLAKIAPVYYAPGNHERVLKENERFESDRYQALLEKCSEYGVRFLSNETVLPELRAGTGNPEIQGAQNLCPAIRITGFDPEYEFYSKKTRKPLTKEDLEERLGRPDRSCYQILLAHDPGPFEEYVKYGADLVLAGHYHGGAIRIAGRGVVSPQVRFFPKYCDGKFEKEGTVMLVTRGAGSHSVNLRLFNYPEIVLIKLSGNNNE